MLLALVFPCNDFSFEWYSFDEVDEAKDQR